MNNRSKFFRNYLQTNDIDFLKMTVESRSELLAVSKEVIKGGKTRYIEYKENELAYEIRKTKLGSLRDELKSGNTEVISELYSQLNKGTYPNKPFQGMLIERLDKVDKPRMIKIPAVTDRIVYALLLKRIEPFFENDLAKYPIYGLKNKGVSLAISHLTNAISNESVVLKLDFQSYFDTISRSILMRTLRDYKLGGEELRLLKAAINAPTNLPKFPKDLSRKHAHKFKPYETKIGLPQGCAFSPLLASIYALDVEKYLKKRNVFSVRYIDDIIILVDSVDQAEEIYQDLKVICEAANLVIHEPLLNEVNDKSYISKADTEIRFLGLDVIDNQACLPEDKIVRFVQVLKERLSQELISRADIEYRNDCIVSFIIGWTKYYREHASDWGKKKEKILEFGLKLIDESTIIEDSTKNNFKGILIKEIRK